MMLADKGYDGDDVRSSLLMHGILPVIPPKANRKEPIGCGFKAYKDRNRIERMFNRLKQFRRIALMSFVKWFRREISSPSDVRWGAR
jgi:transposase